MSRIDARATVAELIASPLLAQSSDASDYAGGSSLPDKYLRSGSGGDRRGDTPPIEKMAKPGSTNRHQRRVERKRDASKHGNSLVEGLFRQAVRHHQAGRLANAEKLYRHIIAIDAQHADSVHWLGVINYQVGRYDTAIDLISQAIGLRDDVPAYHNSLGLTFHAQGKLDEAAACYERFLALEPDHAEAYYNNLGITLERQGKLEDAAACYRHALLLEPNYVEAHNNLGNVLQAQDKPAEATGCYHRVLALRPNHAAAHNNLGMISRSSGRLDEARSYFEAAIKLEPRNPRYYGNLGDIKRFLADDPHLAAMEGLARDIGSLNPQNRIELHFALAKAYADLAQQDRSFHHLLEGNALNRRQIVYDEEAALTVFQRIQRVFTPDLLEQKQGLGERSRVPIFIIGMPRSGTTLVEQILASHREIFGAGELEDFADAMKSLAVPPEAQTEYPEIVPTLCADELRHIGAGYVGRLRSRASSAGRITDKLPGNFLYAGLIHLALPEARIIHVRRDPIDTCLSCFSRLFVSGEFTYELGELGRYYRAYSALMDHWRSVLPRDAMLEVDYEEVVADIAQQSRQIIEYCGMEWDPSCLAFYKTDRPVHTASAAQVRQPIYSTSIGRWRPYEQRLRPLIDALGLRA